MVEVGFDALGAQLAHQLHALHAGVVAQRDHEDVQRGGGGGGAAAHVLHHDHPLDAHAPADAGGGGAAQLLHQAVVAPAAAHGQLAAVGGVGDDLEHGLGVVVQPAHDAGVDGVFKAHGPQVALQLLKVARAVLAQVVQHGGGVRQLRGVLLAVQYAHGVALEALLAGLAQGGQLGFKVGLQLLQVRGPAVGAADGVDVQAKAVDAVGVEDVHGQLDDLRVHAGVLRAEDLHAVLVELAQPAGLGLLVAEAGAGGVVQLHRQRLGVHVALDERPHRAGGALGLQRDGAVALVLEGVHLLLHHIGGVAHAALEQLGVFEDGGADLLVARQRAGFAHGPRDFLPAVGVFGQHVLGALGGLGQHLSISPFGRY